MQVLLDYIFIHTFCCSVAFNTELGSGYNIAAMTAVPCGPTIVFAPVVTVIATMGVVPADTTAITAAVIVVTSTPFNPKVLTVPAISPVTAYLLTE